MKASPILHNLLGELRAGRFRPRAVRRFLKDGIRHAVDIAWTLDGLRRSFYAASAVMAVVLAAIGVMLELAAPGVIGPRTIGATVVLFFFVFGMTLLQLGLVRAESTKEVYDRFVLPNILTLLRLLVLPYLVTCLVALHQEDTPPGLAPASLALVVFAVVSDVLDGTLSRRLGMTSDFGRIYDPVVDLVFHSSVAVALYHSGSVGFAYLFTVLTRYLLPPVAGSFLYLFREPFQVKSTIMGKLSSLVLSVFLTLFVAVPALGLPHETWNPLVHGVIEPTCVVVCAATIVFFLGRGVKILKKTGRNYST